MHDKHTYHQPVLDHARKDFTALDKNLSVDETRKKIREEGLGESISIQSMTVTIQTLHTAQPSLKWYLKNLFKEIQTAGLIGLSCAVLVGLIVLIWKGSLISAAVIALSVLLVQLIAAVLGLSVPSALHAFKLDPKLAAGPITLALTDISTILFYFGLATVLL